MVSSMLLTSIQAGKVKVKVLGTIFSQNNCATLRAIVENVSINVIYYTKAHVMFIVGR